MNHEVFDQLTQLIDALRAETQASSITPERLGSIIQQIVDILPDLDDSDIANAAATALEAAQAAINRAESALSAARSAEAAAAEVADQMASIASDLADALENSTTAMYAAQQAATAATAATNQVSQLSTRVSTLEQFKAWTEHEFGHTPAYHSASWLVDEANPTMVRFNAMSQAIDLNRMLLLHGFPAISASKTSTVITVVFALGDRYDIYTVTKGTSNCTVTRVSVPLVAVQNGLEGNSIPHGRIGFEGQNEIFYIYNEASEEWQRISTGLFDLSWITDLDDSNAEEYANRLLYLHAHPDPGTMYMVNNHPAIISSYRNGSYDFIEVCVWKGNSYDYYSICPDHDYDIRTGTQHYQFQ